MNANLDPKWIVAGMLVMLPAISVPAQDGIAGAPSPAESAAPPATNSASTKPVAAATGQSQPSEPGAKGPAQYPVGVGEILKMVQAGVSKDVMKTYIESAQIAPHLSAADLVTLKEHGVPDDLTVALLKRSSELAAQDKQAGVSTEAPAKVSGTMSLNELVALLRSNQASASRLDPESYDYFQHYYLYPRTLASANQRLYSSYPAFPGYGPYYSGYGSPWSFRPRFFAPQFPGP
jgi:hypothetical protein